MSSFFYVLWPGDDELCIPLAMIGFYDRERDRLLMARDRVRDWSTPRLEVESDELVDYHPNDLGMRLCSPRMRDVIDAGSGPKDDLQWLPAEVVDIFGTAHDYFILHLPGDDDVLNKVRSILVGEDSVVKPVLSAEKVEGRQLLRCPGAALTWFVSTDLRRKLEAAGITGVHFEKAPVD